MKKETENFIQLLIWIIANEITKDQGYKDDRKKVFRGIRNLLSKKYSIHGDSDESDDDPDHESIEFAAEIINLYYNRFAERTDDGDDNGALKLISEKEFRLMNGKCNKEFKKLTIIGHGTFGNVYRAVNALDNEEYAIKKVSLYGTKL
jgi:serine/threonine protein kinase